MKLFGKTFPFRRLGLGYFLFLFFISNNIAQSVDRLLVGASGSADSSDELYISWSLGEPITGIASNGETITQGFQQGSLYAITSILDEGGLKNLNVYPNPSPGVVYLSYARVRETLTLKLYSISGTFLEEQDIHFAKQEVAQINLNKYSSGRYLLKVYSSDYKLQKVFKIVKVKN